MMAVKNGRNGLLLAVLCLVFVAFPITAQAAQYYVDAAFGTNTPGNGGSPGAGAWKTITYALSQVSGTGHTIHVAAGTYNTALGETFPLNMENGVSLLGAGAATTTVDAGGTNVVINANNIGGSTTLDGFTITNGSGGWSGGGIHNSGSSWTISNCTITNNQGTEGGGILFENGDSSTVTNCTISYNSLSSSPTMPYWGGGIHMYFNSGTPELTNCTISNNEAPLGGGIGLYYSSAIFTNCNITENEAYYRGGAMNIQGSGAGTEFTNCTITDNYADSCGGAFSFTASEGIQVVNTIIWGNTTGTLFQSGCTTTYFCGNTCPTHYEIQMFGGAGDCAIDLDYSDFNPANIDPCSDCDGASMSWTGSNYITADPLFVDPVADDYHLQGTPTPSPCIDAGTNDTVTYPYIPTDDIDGESRDANPDIGSDEYYAAGPTCVDNDSDGYGVCPDCGTANGCTYDGDDCDDTDDTINPGATEITCNGIDENCNGMDDDAPDADIDTYDICNPADPGDTDGKDADCNDGDDSINPGATDVPCDGIDQDCSGADDPCKVELGQSASGYVIADAILLAPPSGQVLVDNTDAETGSTGTWGTSSWAPGYYGTNYHYHAAGAGTETFTWTPTVPSAGTYEVWARWTDGSTRANDATYTIYHDGGSTPVVKNQQLNSGQWVSLGTFDFDGADDKVELVQSASGIVVADAIWLTPPSGEVIVDNPAGTETGTWGTSSWCSQRYGSNYRYHAAGTEGETFTWTPTITIAGTYEVFAYWCADPSRADDATYTVYHDGGSTPVEKNQQLNGGEWASLGTFSFDGVGEEKVELVQSENGMVIADAVRFAPPPEEEIVDNTDAEAGSTGTWGTSSWAPGYYGSNYHHHAAGALGDTFTWTPTVPSAGTYEVFARWTDGSTRANDATYTVYHDGGSTPVAKNQRLNGGEWVSLGTFSFDGVGEEKVVLADSNSGIVIADAVLLAPPSGEAIVDNADAEASSTGTWGTSSWAPGYYATDYRYHTPQAGTDMFTWSLTIPSAGTYEVFARWANSGDPDTSRATDATYTIYHEGGSTPVAKNQRYNGGEWVSLGTYDFP